jgi:hypothetical protein
MKAAPHVGRQVARWERTDVEVWQRQSRGNKRTDRGEKEKTRLQEETFFAQHFKLFRAGLPDLSLAQNTKNMYNINDH